VTRARRPSVIPSGSWPRRMAADLAAAYVGEKTIEAFLSRVGSEYPWPCVKEGRRQLWLIEDLDEAVAQRKEREYDLAEDL
jgi:hypothetical protein